jgi:hypothetical protein
VRRDFLPAGLQRKEPGDGGLHPRLMEPAPTLLLDLFSKIISATDRWACSRLHRVGSSGQVVGAGRQL